MDNLPVMPDPPGITRNLAPPDEDVIPSADLCRDPQLPEGIREWLWCNPFAHKSIIEVLEVMVNSSSTGHAARQVHPVVPEPAKVDLAVGILVQPDYDRRTVPPKVENRLPFPVLKAPLVEGEIEMGIDRIIYQ